jgi:hypothetical protein
MHRLSAAARRSLVIALGTLTLLFVVLNFGVFLKKTYFPPWTCELKERTEVVAIEKLDAAARAEIERRHIEAEMARVEVEMRRVERDLREMELKGVRSALDGARDAMTRKEIYLKRPALPTTLSREGSFHIQLRADELQFN